MDMQTSIKKTRIGLAFVSLILFFSTSNAAVTVEPRADDTIITKNILAKIANTKPLSHTKIHIKTKDGVVSITGFVAHDYQEDLVFKLAESTDGVKDVNGSLEPSRDSLITARIEGILIRNKLLSPDKENLKLTTDKGVVSIYGKAPNQIVEDNIIKYVQSVRGVVNVISHIDVLQKALLFCPLKQDIMVNTQPSTKPDKEA